MRILRGTILGGIAYFIVGWLVWGMLFSDYVTSHTNQCTMRPEGDMVWWALIASNLIYALIFTLFLRWSGAKNWLDGLKTGAFIGFLISATVDLSFWSMNTLFNGFGVLLVDVALSTAVAAILGLVIVFIWGKEAVK